LSGSGERVVQEETVDDNVLKGGWVVAARVTSQAAQFLTLIVAARVMMPADFGTFALLSAIAVGLTRFSEAGWREYVMTARDSAACAQANMLALICGFGAFFSGLVASFGLLMIYQSASSAAAMLLMGLWVILATLSATQAGILVKRNELKSLSLIQIIGEVAGFSASLVAFSLGGGIFGLVAAKLATQATIMALSVATTRWFPVVRLRRKAAGEAMLFSRRILVARIISYAQDNVAIFVIGSIVGPAGAGLFRAAGRLAGALFEVISEPVRLLAWSTFNVDNPGRAANRLLALTFIVATPLFVGLALQAENMVHILLGPEWTGCAPLLVAFAIAGWFNSINIVSEPLLVMNGRIELVPRLSFAFTALNLVVLLISAPFGIFWIAVGQTLAAIAMLPVILAIQKRKGGVSLSALGNAAAPALVGATALLIAVAVARWALPHDVGLVSRAAIEIAAGGLAYLAVAALLVPRHIWRLQDPESAA